MNFDVQFSENSLYVSRRTRGSWHVYHFKRQAADTPWSLNEQYLQHTTGPSLNQTHIQPRSQVEYAYIANGEDIGGVTHGMETVTNAAVYLDSAPIAEDAIGGMKLEIVQIIEASDGTSKVADTVLRHKISRSSRLEIKYEHTWAKAADVGWYYGAMLPLQNRQNGSDVFNKMFHDGSVYLFDDYLGQNSVRKGARSEIRGTVATGKDPQTGRTLQLNLSVHPETVDFFRHSPNPLKAWWQINRGAGDEWSKFYVTRAASSHPDTVDAGDVWTGMHVQDLTVGALPNV